MTEHFTRNTESFTSWCKTCGRLTQHAVSYGRLGRCLEHESQKYSKAQLKRREQVEHDAKNPSLFGGKP